MKIAVGLSGGVDSSVTAAFLKEAGHEVIGIIAPAMKRLTQLRECIADEKNTF